MFWYGNRPCQVFAINWPSGLTSSPQAYVDVLPARAAYSHSASLGRRRPAQFAYASASDRRPEPQGGRTSPRYWTQGRTDAASRHRPTSATTAASCSIDRSRCRGKGQRAWFKLLRREVRNSA